MLRCCLLLFLFPFLMFDGYAQSSMGCRLSNGKLYGPKIGTALLGATLIPLSLGITVNVYMPTEVPTVASTCPGWASNVIPTGNKCATQTLLGTGLLGGYLLATNEGTEVTYNFVECNLDDHTYALILGFGIFGFVLIKRKKYF